jgi:hypothetical protein
MQVLGATSESVPDWEQVRPVLDAAMSELGDEDREAVLLRFFKNSNFRAIGAALGTSDDAAQKRVSRALEKLHSELVRRGVTTPVVALSTALSANAVQIAPTGLAATLSTGALSGATAVSATFVMTTKAIAMTTIQKAVIAAALAVGAGTGVYEASQASRLRAEAQALQRQQAPLSEQVHRLQVEAEEAKSRLAALQAESTESNPNAAELLKLRGEVARLRQQVAQRPAATGTEDGPLTQWLLAVGAKAAELKQHLEQMPEKKIPELHFLTQDDWLTAAKAAKFDTDSDVRKSLSNLRSLAKNKMPMGWALGGFIRAHNGQLPTDLSQLKPYFKTPTDDGSTSHWNGVDPARDDAILDAILSRYTLLHTGNISDFDAKTWLVVEKAPVDKDFDTRGRFGNGFGGTISTGIGAGDPDDKTYGSE